MSILERSVADAMELSTKHKDGHQWVEYSPDAWCWMEGWTKLHNIADKLMDEHKIETEYFGRRWCATCEGVSAQHQDRKTAALMAFCKFKGVSYE